MFDWLIGPLVHGLSTVDNLVDKLRNVLATFWSGLVSFFTEQMQATGYVAASAGDVAVQSVYLLVALVSLGIYIPRVLLPRWLSQAISQVEGMIGNAIHQLHMDIDAAIHDLSNWAHQELDDLRNFAHRELTDIRNTIATVMEVLTWVRDHVEQFLTDPDVLAEWLFLPLVHYGERWARANAVRVSRWFLSVAVDATVSSAHIIEDIITEIF